MAAHESSARSAVLAALARPSAAVHGVRGLDLVIAAGPLCGAPWELS